MVVCVVYVLGGQKGIGMILSDSYNIVKKHTLKKFPDCYVNRNCESEQSVNLFTYTYAEWAMVK